MASAKAISEALCLSPWLSPWISPSRNTTWVSKGKDSHNNPWDTSVSCFVILLAFGCALSLFIPQNLVLGQLAATIIIFRSGGVPSVGLS